MIQNQPSPDLQRRIHSQRKRRRDVREVFEQNEGTLLSLPPPPLSFSLSPSLSKYKKSHDRSYPTVHAGVQLVSVRRARTDETTYQVPAQTEELELPPSVPVPIATSEPANEEAMDHLDVQPPGIHCTCTCTCTCTHSIHVHVGCINNYVYYYSNLYEYSSIPWAL